MSLKCKCLQRDRLFERGGDAEFHMLVVDRKRSEGSGHMKRVAARLQDCSVQQGFELWR